MTFFGNLIFAIIARMFCGNHLKLFKFSHETIKKVGLLSFVSACICRKRHGRLQAFFVFQVSRLVSQLLCMTFAFPRTTQTESNSGPIRRVQPLRPLEKMPFESKLRQSIQYQANLKLATLAYRYVTQQSRELKNSSHANIASHTKTFKFCLPPSETLARCLLGGFMK